MKCKVLIASLFFATAAQAELVVLDKQQYITKEGEVSHLTYSVDVNTITREFGGVTYFFINKEVIEHRRYEMSGLKQVNCSTRVFRFLNHSITEYVNNKVVKKTFYKPTTWFASQDLPLICKGLLK